MRCLLANHKLEDPPSKPRWWQAPSPDVTAVVVLEVCTLVEMEEVLLSIRLLLDLLSAS